MAARLLIAAASRRAVLAAAAIAVAAFATGAATGARGGSTGRALAAAAPGARSLTIAWGGDLTPGSAYGTPADGGRRLLRAVGGTLRGADLAAVNLEGTFGTGGASKCAGSASPACFAFQAPPGHAAALSAAGIDVANLANNHAFDFGAAGMGQTVRALAARRVAVTGRPGEIRRLRVRGRRVALLGFSAYPWSSRIDDLPTARAFVREAAGGADVVVVLMHAGAEGAQAARTPLGGEVAFGESRGDARAFARAVVDAGADLVLGSGPHVLRGIELYRGRLIAYSLGNLAGSGNFATAGVLALSGLLRVRVAADGRFRSGHLASLRLDRGGAPRRDRERAAARLVTALGRADFGAAAVAVDGRGRLVAARAGAHAPAAAR